MTKVRLSAEAQADIEAIWDAIAQDDISAADRFAELLSTKFLALARHPHLGRSCEDLRPGVRRLVVGNYLVFYRIRPDSIEIARVLHGARDIDALLDLGEGLPSDPEVGN